MNALNCLPNLKYIRDTAVIVATLFLSAQGFIVTKEVDKMEDVARMTYTQQTPCNHYSQANPQFHLPQAPKMYAMPQQPASVPAYPHPQTVQQASAPQPAYPNPPTAK